LVVMKVVPWLDFMFECPCALKETSTLILNTHYLDELSFDHACNSVIFGATGLV
jgi:hypothetical protein